MQQSRLLALCWTLSITQALYKLCSKSLVELYIGHLKFIFRYFLVCFQPIVFPWPVKVTDCI